MQDNLLDRMYMTKQSAKEKKKNNRIDYRAEVRMAWKKFKESVKMKIPRCCDTSTTEAAFSTFAASNWKSVEHVT